CDWSSDVCSSDLLRTPEAQGLRAALGTEHLTALARAVTDELRAELRSHDELPSRDETHSRDGDEKSRTLDDDESLMRDRAQSKSDDDFTRESLLAEAARRLARAAQSESAHGLRRVINATGVVLHTNLGRAPLSESARRAVAEEAAGYCTLEYDTETGARGRRGARAEE